MIAGHGFCYRVMEKAIWLGEVLFERAQPGNEQRRCLVAMVEECVNFVFVERISAHGMCVLNPVGEVRFRDRLVFVFHFYPYRFEDSLARKKSSYNPLMAFWWNSCCAYQIVCAWPKPSNLGLSAPEIRSIIGLLCVETNDRDPVEKAGER